MTRHHTAHFRMGSIDDVPLENIAGGCKQCGGNLEPHQALTKICTACFRASQQETQPVIRIDSMQKRLALIPEPTPAQAVDLAYGVHDLDGKDFLDLKHTEEDARY